MTSLFELDQQNIVYYPFSGADFNVIKLLNKYSKENIRNYIFADTCINENEGYYLFDTRLNYFENNLGLSGFSIVEKNTVSLKDQHDFLNSVNEFKAKQSSSYQDYIKKIANPEITEYELEHKEIMNKVRLWFFKYEAAAVLDYLIQSFEKSGIKQNEINFALILQCAGTGFNNSPFFEYLKSGNYKPHFIATTDQYVSELYTKDYYLSEGQHVLNGLPIEIKWSSAKVYQDRFKIWTAISATNYLT